MIPAVRRFFSIVWSLILSRPAEPSYLEDQATGDLQNLLLMSQTMTSIRDMDEMLGYLLGEIHKILRVDCGVLTVDNNGRFKVRCHRGLSNSFVTALDVPLGSGPIGECFSFGKVGTFSRKEMSGLDPAGLFAGEHWNSLVLAPISIQNHNLGVFLAGSPRDRFFTRDVIDSIDAFVQILSVGIRNAQLLEGMEKFNRRLAAEVSSTTQELTRTNNRLIHRVRELKALYEITLSSESSASLADVFSAVSAKVRELFNVEHTCFFINQSSRDDMVHLVSPYNNFDIQSDISYKISINSNEDISRKPLSAMVLESFQSKEIRNQPSISLSLSGEFGISGVPGHTEILNLSNIVSVPLKTAHKNMGVMVLANPIADSKSQDGGSDFPNDEEMKTLTLIASRVASSIETVELNLEIQQRLGDLSTLQDINETFYATPVLEFILAKMAKIILRSLKCTLCDFLLFESGSSRLVTHPASSSIHGSDMTPDHVFVNEEKDVTTQVFLDRKPRIIDNVEAEFSLSRIGVQQKIGSIMLVPLKVDEEIIGILRVGSSERSYFNPHHLRLTELIADRSAVIVQNARLYEKIMRANMELEKLNHMKTEFVSMVSHELRTPVTAVKGFVDIVLEGEAGQINDQQNRFLQIAHNSIERLTLLIADLLDISRIESGQMRMEMVPISLAPVLQESLETHQKIIESKSIKLSSSIKTDLPDVMADESRIRQVMDNLLSNALKFTPAQGSMFVKSDDLGDFVLVTVQDTGVGIRKEDQDKIFSMFYQVDSSLTRHVGGTGLGLAISKAIIEMHGGKIWVESELGKGSTFRFLIPRIREQK
ncbi:MAG: hypothetical protein A2902_00785 [Elusimicrobia bacterium RIFCSPLOWO2_01_FULL_64_13]|nr:MAG: hypothetical protein A2636_01110 [Elusimicrobia bacterium RIFCSPHIGHO2_01_FULL_64_10]OGR97843.1 MAG: hypothetical protein A2902_00785 [Elusimicrobia bacterium RIFCSPLOWO2_01_FULL_64_13]